MGSGTGLDVRRFFNTERSDVEFMRKILIQFDTDEHPSSFDQVVAVDSGVEQLFSYGGISEENVEGLVHGAIFTRGPADLNNTAIFVGGSDVAAGERVAQKVRKTCFGPMRVSLMMDSNGCNTTAAAAVVAARTHVSLSEATALVLGGTGPVGQRVAQLLAREGSRVRVGSRSRQRAADVCDAIAAGQESAHTEPVAATSTEDCLAAAAGVDIIFAAGAAGVCFLPEGALSSVKGLQVAVDLNAVPPTGIADIEATDKAVERNGVLHYGALGVGGAKMKVHKQAIRRLFEGNDRTLDTIEIYHLALEVAGLAS
jgi:hypothetical protein